MHVRARGWLLLPLLLLPGLLPGGNAGAPARDLIVLTTPGAELPPLGVPFIPLRALDGLVVLDATPSMERLLASLPQVRAVHPAVPLERHEVAVEGRLHLRLTRATPDAAGLGADAPTGAGVTVAVVDSGVDATHPDLRGRVLRNVRLAADGLLVDAPGDRDGHGTHVAGIVAASGESSGGRHRGVAPGAALVGVDISGRFTTASALLAYDWLLVHRESLGLDVVVNAWGRVERGGFDPRDPVALAIDRLVAEGVVVLFSASNRGPAPASLSLEAQHPRVLTVGAVDAAGRPMDYSSRGPVRAHPADWIKPDVVAPGEGVVGLRSLQSPSRPDDPDALHALRSGTSQAVPHVAGIVALLRERHPSLAPADVGAALRGAAIDLGAPGPDDATGFGLVDARDALRKAAGLPLDRGNPLVAGGPERYEDAGPAAVAPRGGILGLARAEREAWRQIVPVKPGATNLTFEVAWRASVGSPRATLERDGRVVAHAQPAEPDGRGGLVLRGRLDAPEPGVHVLRVHAAAPVPARVEGAVDLRLPPNATRLLEPDARHRSQENAARPDADARADAALVPTLLGLAVSGAAAAGLAALAGLARRDARGTRREDAAAPMDRPDPGDAAE